MRPFLTAVHRYAGLLTAAFLFVSGVTGAVISWDHALDAALNPHLTKAATPGLPQDPLVLAAQVEARHPQAEVTFIPLAAEPGDSLALGVEARAVPGAERLPALGFNQVFLDPVSGAELGRREWGAVWPITRETFVSFLFKLHYSLHVPEMWGTDRWGIWLLGIIAMVWTLDCFVGLYLTLPSRRRAVPSGRGFWRRWAPAWKLRLSSGAYKLNFDWHRAASLWTWGLLFIVAFTAFSLNLYREVFFPAMRLVSNVTPSPFDERAPTPLNQPLRAQVGYAQVLEAARTEAHRRGWTAPAGGVFYARNYGIYGVNFYTPEDEHGAGGVGHPALYYDGADGRLLGDRQPWQGTAADLFVQAQFPLHSGRILGLPGRILISLLGLVVASLSVTGVVIWLRKRRGRQAASATTAALPAT